MELALGEIFDGEVIRVTSFGAFIELEKGVSGLVHISQVADSYITDINQFLQVNDTVKVKVISIDESGKIGLSIKEAQEPKEVVPPPVVISAEEKSEDRFEDKLAKFMKDSDEKQQSLKKHLETKKSR